MLQALLDSPQSASLTQLHFEDAMFDSLSMYKVATKATRLTTLSVRTFEWPFIDRRNDNGRDIIRVDRGDGDRGHGDRGDGDRGAGDRGGGGRYRDREVTLLPSLRDLSHLSGSLTDLDICCYIPLPPPDRPDLRPLHIGLPNIPNLRRLAFTYHALLIRYVRDGTLHSHYPALETLRIHRSHPKIAGWIDVAPKENVGSCSTTADDARNTSPGTYHTELGWRYCSEKITLALLAPLAKLAAILFPSTVTYECRRRSIALISK